MKQQQMNEFGELLERVLWSQKPKTHIKKLENLILTKKQFDFSKEEFIDFSLVQTFDAIGYFQLEFFRDSYDAVTFRTTDYSTIQLLRERLSDFNRLINEA
jgi:hypothetical protein